MHKTIRHAIFETNSSSTHALSIGSSIKIRNELKADTQGVCNIHPFIMAVFAPRLYIMHEIAKLIKEIHN